MLEKNEMEERVAAIKKRIKNMKRERPSSKRLASCSTPPPSGGKGPTSKLTRPMRSERGGAGKELLFVVAVCYVPRVAATDYGRL